MTATDLTPLFVEVFGARLGDTNRYGDGSFSDATDGQWFQWCDGEIIRSGSIEELHSVHSTVRANGGGDLRAVLREWDHAGRARVRNAAAAIVCEILLEKRIPRNGRLH